MKLELKVAYVDSLGTCLVRISELNSWTTFGGLTMRKSVFSLLNGRSKIVQI